jgi:hypothetical protein
MSSWSMLKMVRLALNAKERTMAYPTAYTSAVAIPLPSKQAVRQIMGKSHDPRGSLNVLMTCLRRQSA